MQKMLWLGVSGVSDTYHLLLFCHPSKSSDLVMGSSIFKNYNVMARSKQSKRRQAIFLYQVIPPNRQIWSRDIPYSKILKIAGIARSSLKRWQFFYFFVINPVDYLCTKIFFLSLRSALRWSNPPSPPQSFRGAIATKESIKRQDCFNNKLLHDNK